MVEVGDIGYDYFVLLIIIFVCEVGVAGEAVSLLFSVSPFVALIPRYPK